MQTISGSQSTKQINVNIVFGHLKNAVTIFETVALSAVVTILIITHWINKNLKSTLLKKLNGNQNCN